MSSDDLKPCQMVSRRTLSFDWRDRVISNMALMASPTMKSFNPLLSRRPLSVSCIALLLSVLSSFVANGHPFASNVTRTNSSGLVGFTLNEDGAYVTVVYED